jgi:hypothetical protein
MNMKENLAMLSVSALLMLAVFAPSDGAEMAIVYVDPPLMTAVPIGETFPINVTVANVTDLYAWSFQVCYSSEVLNASNWALGPIFKPSLTMNITLIWTDNYNETHGLIQIDCTFLGFIPTFNGTTTLATVYFTVKADGFTVLHLQNTLLLDDSSPFSAEIPHTTADGNFGGLTTDINGDGEVNIVDITIVAIAFDSEVGDQNYNAQADLDHNGVIDIVDISMVAVDFGKIV